MNPAEKAAQKLREAILILKGGDPEGKAGSREASLAVTNAEQALLWIDALQSDVLKR